MEEAMITEDEYEALSDDDCQSCSLHAEVVRLRRAEAILFERDRQDAKWGTPQYNTLSEWVTILSEEVGELAAAVLHHTFGGQKHPELDWQKEAIQVAAVALAIVEQYPLAQALGIEQARIE